MVMSRLVFALAVGLVAVSGSAMAEDEVVLSASHAVKLPTEAEQAKAKADAQARADAASKPVSTQAQILALQAAAQPVTRDRPAIDEAPKPAGYEVNGRTIHGGAGVSVGTGGYSSAYVYSLIPIGETGTLGIAYSQTDFGKNAGRYYDNYGGRYGYGRALRGGKSQSVAVMLDMTGDDLDPPENCAPGFRDRGRYIEPVWVTHMNGGRDCLVDTDQP